MEFAKFGCEGETLKKGLEHIFKADSFFKNGGSCMNDVLTGMIDSSNEDFTVGIIRAAMDSAPDDIFICSVSDLPCSDKSVDLIIYWDQNEFVSGLDTEEILRIMKPNGALLFCKVQPENSGFETELFEDFKQGTQIDVPIGPLMALVHILDKTMTTDEISINELYFSLDEYYDTPCHVNIMFPRVVQNCSKRHKIRRMIAEPFYDWKMLFPELNVFIDKNNFQGILTEALSSGPKWKDWPESHYGEGGNMDWKVFPFLHCFPASDTDKMTWITKNCQLCPNTSQLLERLPGIRTALFSRMGPQTRISSHRGWSDLANDVLRCHICLKIPKNEEGDDFCGIWVEGQKRSHRNAEIVVFDDSKLHKAFNDSDEERIVLIIDLIRPGHIPKGTAKQGMTPELEGLIAAYT